MENKPIIPPSTLEYIFSTVGLLLFCVEAGIAVWFLFEHFQNNFYKLSTLFLVAIAISNIGSQYLIMRNARK